MPHVAPKSISNPMGSFTNPDTISFNHGQPYILWLELSQTTGAQTLKITKLNAPSTDRPASARASSRRVRLGSAFQRWRPPAWHPLIGPARCLHSRRVPPGSRAPRSSGQVAERGERGNDQIKRRFVWFAVKSLTLTGWSGCHMQPAPPPLRPRSPADGSQAVRCTLHVLFQTKSPESRHVAALSGPCAEGRWPAASIGR